MVSGHQHIDYQFSGLEDDDGEDCSEDAGNDDEIVEGTELSFNYRSNKQGPYTASTSPNSAEVGI